MNPTGIIVGIFMLLVLCFFWSETFWSILIWLLQATFWVILFSWLSASSLVLRLV